MSTEHLTAVYQWHSGACVSTISGSINK